MATGMKALLFVALLLTVCAAAQETTNTVALAQLPAAVQKAVREQLGSAKLGEIERTVENGDVSFTVNMIKAGKEREFTIGEDGKLLSVEVDLEETPPAVQKTIKVQVGQGELGTLLKT